MTKTVTLSRLPSALSTYPKAAGDMLPVIGKPARIAADAQLPDTAYTVSDVRVDLGELQEYCRATGLPYGSTLPLTYLFVLHFPMAMATMTARDFPFGPVGGVHAENVIERFREIGSTEPLTITTRAQNLREHRKGMLVDVVSEFSVGREPVARQTSTFLKQQRTSLSGEQRGPAPRAATPPPPDRVLSVDLPQIRRYAAASGDRNPIHMTNLTAKAFGFDRAIAHGMWSAAAALANLDGSLPGAVTYRVRFGKPILLPAKVNLYTRPLADGGYEVSILNRKKGYPHLTGTVTPD